MAYTRTNWVSGETPLSAENMNNIEDGIEELNSNLDSLIKFKEYTYTYSLAAGASLNITGQNFGLSVPTGYSVLGLVYFNSGSSLATPTYVAHNGGTYTAASVRNTGTSALNPTFRVKFAYILSSAVS